MQDQGMTAGGGEPPASEATSRRNTMRARTLRTALQKREMKVPTYTVAEAAALLSISPEHLHRLIRANAFPTVAMSDGRTRGCNVIPAQAIEARLEYRASDGASHVATGGVR